jgi:hypothetical protein
MITLRRRNSHATRWAASAALHLCFIQFQPSPAVAPGFWFLEIDMNEHTSTPEIQPIPDPAPAQHEWELTERDHAQRANELLSANKTVLFDALSAAGITTVVVCFDGYGDSGQIEDIDARIGDKPCELPDERIELLDPIWGSSEIERQTQTIREAIEVLAYACLRKTHNGWEDNDGAFGDFMFDVGERSIRLDFNERYTDSHFYSHAF